MAKRNLAYTKKHPVIGYILIVFAMADLFELLSTFDLLSAILLVVTSYVAYNFSFAKRPKIQYQKIIAAIFGLAGIIGLLAVLGVGFIAALSSSFSGLSQLTSGLAIFDIVLLAITGVDFYVAYLLWKNK